MSSTAAIARRPGACGSRCDHEALTVCVPAVDRVSTATPVPETWELDRRRRAPNASRLRAAVRLLKDAFMRLRVADGFSHARSLAYVDGAHVRAGDHRA